MIKDPFGVIVFTIGLLCLCYQSYIVWFKPNQYCKDIHDRRIRLNSQFPWLPNWFVGYIFFFEHQGFNVWWARILSFIAVIICILGLIASFHGPF